MLSLFRKPTKSLTPRAGLRCELLEERQLLAGGLHAAIGVMGPKAELIALPPPAYFSSFGVSDASHDDTPHTVFTGGAVRINYDLTTGVSLMLAPQQGPGGGPQPPPPPPPTPLSHVRIEVWQGGAKLAEVGHFTGMSLDDGLINLNGLALTGGEMSLKARAYFKNGTQDASSFQTLTVKQAQIISGDFEASTFDFSTFTGDALVFHGRGGTDRFKLNALGSSVASFNGASLSYVNTSTPGAAIYQGVAVDYMRLTNGKEIYMTGVEQLEVLAQPSNTLARKKSTARKKTLVTAPFYQTQVINLMIRPNDPNFAQQWNLHATDVPDAWRFTKGSAQIMLVTLDTGVLPVANATANGGGAITGMDPNRLITGSGDGDNFKGTSYGHGHKATSVMIGTPNDNAFHAGINWVSQVYVEDVYDDSNLFKAIPAAMNYAIARGMKVVFQGGIQGEGWFTRGGTRSELEALISSYSDISLFAIAAGNGGPGGNLTDPNFATSVSGVAKLQTTHDNVMAVGAAQRTQTTVNGFTNATDVFLAAYSNRGSNLTMVAPTDSLTTNHFGSSTFGGTSCANPNLAAMASLVWSANPHLRADQVRSILETTALDLGDTGRDDTFGAGLVDSGMAVRKAVAMSRDYALATLGTPLFSSHVFDHVLQVQQLPILQTIPPMPTPPLPSAALDELFAQGAEEAYEMLPLRCGTMYVECEGQPLVARPRMDHLMSRVEAARVQADSGEFSGKPSASSMKMDWGALKNVLRKAFA